VEDTTMTAPTDTFIDNFVGGAQRTQEAVTSAMTDAVRTWTDAFSGIAGGQPALPDAQIVVDRWFEVAQTVLDTQKAFAKTVVGASTQAAEVVTEQATKAAETVTAQTETVVGQATKAAKAAGEQAASTARAARNSATARKI
jgi:hypothetical protein